MDKDVSLPKRILAYAATGVFMGLIILYDIWVIQKIWIWHIDEYVAAPSLAVVLGLYLIIGVTTASYKPWVDEDREKYGIKVIGFSLKVTTLSLVAAFVARMLF